MSVIFFWLFGAPSVQKQYKNTYFMHPILCNEVIREEQLTLDFAIAIVSPRLHRRVRKYVRTYVSLVFAICNNMDLDTVGHGMSAFL